MKTQWTSIVSGKLKFMEQNPHNALAGFAQYHGYTKPECKAIILQAFAEYNRVTSRSQQTHVSWLFFSRETTASQQFWEWANCADADLHAYRELFLMSQEYAFCSCVERYTEGEHKRMKHALHRGLGAGKPAYTAARQRYPQVAQMLDSSDGLDFTVKHWRSCLIGPLLQHCFSAAQLKSMSLAEKHAHIYKYHKDAVFKDTKAEQGRVAKATALRDIVQEKPRVAATPLGSTLIAYLKDRFNIGLVFSVPEELWTVLQQAVESPPAISLTTVVNCMQPRDLDFADLTKSVFFQVVDPKPENKTAVRSPHLALDRTRICVRVFDTQICNGDQVHTVKSNQDAVRSQWPHGSGRNHGHGGHRGHSSGRAHGHSQRPHK